jgi:hypothetical protein
VIAPKVREAPPPKSWTPLTSRAARPAIFCTTVSATVVRPWLLASASLPDPPPVVATVPLGPAVLAPLVERVEVCSVAALVICSISFDQNRGGVAVTSDGHGGGEDLTQRLL